MADNLIEQFFIDIELNTKGVGKQAKEIDKILETLGNKQFKSEIQREKRKQYAYKKTYEKRKKYLEDLKKLEEFGLPSGNGNPKRPSSPKSPKSPLKVHPEKIKNEKIKAEKAFREEEVRLAQKSLNARLKAFKAHKKKQQRIAKSIDDIQSTAYYRKFKHAGGDTHQVGLDLKRALSEGRSIKPIIAQMRDLTMEQERYNRKLQKTNIIQKGVTDSTRNMIRSYASLYALFEGTVAIKRVGQEYQGLDASMLAAAGSSEAAAKDFEFINGLVDQMGLSLKDTSDAWVKFKFAAKGKISQEQQEDVFTGLSMFGTSLKVDSESMKRSQKALIQIRNCLAA